MADQPESAPVVTVFRGAAHAHSEPTFLIRVGDTYYATVAVWEYRADQAKTDHHRAGVRQVEEAFGKGQQVPCVRVDSPGEIMLMAGHTGPPP